MAAGAIGPECQQQDFKRYPQQTLVASKEGAAHPSPAIQERGKSSEEVKPSNFSPAQPVA